MHFSNYVTVSFTYGKWYNKISFQSFLEFVILWIRFGGLIRFVGVLSVSLTSVSDHGSASQQKSLYWGASKVWKDIKLCLFAVSSKEKYLIFLYITIDFCCFIWGILCRKKQSQNSKNLDVHQCIVKLWKDNSDSRWLASVSILASTLKLMDGIHKRDLSNWYE